MREIFATECGAYHNRGESHTVSIRQHNDSWWAIRVTPCKDDPTVFMDKAQMVDLRDALLQELPPKATTEGFEQNMPKTPNVSRPHIRYIEICGCNYPCGYDLDVKEGIGYCKLHEHAPEMLRKLQQVRQLLFFARVNGAGWKEDALEFDREIAALLGEVE